MSENFLVKRHLAKTMTWRIIGSIDTMTIGWIISGNPLIGMSIGGTEVITKMVLYFFHERLWFKYGYKKNKSVGRHLAKTITWRTIGTIDTIILAWLISGDPTIGLKVGGIEAVTKLGLYYLHERIWHKYDFGIEHKNNNDG